MLLPSEPRLFHLIGKGYLSPCLDHHPCLRVEEHPAGRTTKHGVREGIISPGGASTSGAAKILFCQVGAVASQTCELPIEGLLNSSRGGDGIGVPFDGLSRESRSQLFDDPRINQLLKGGRALLRHGVKD